MSANGTYNGYANYQTWNVILWMSNDEGLYNFASGCDSYNDFKSSMREYYGEQKIAFETPDGVAWNDSGLNSEEITKFWEENFSLIVVLDN